jgi:hypothetical protein
MRSGVFPGGGLLASWRFLQKTGEGVAVKKGESSLCSGRFLHSIPFEEIFPGKEILGRQGGIRDKKRGHKAPFEREID